ncbi:MAG: hypothetical protein GWN46_16085 [Gammaproteobacteria bacterium]|nr:hypothetical protein [Gammaproteobacteria bacterium]NIM73273.1 hypothetical protein [Gammaproteobacteria bacterium]NIS05548.1 hypothetical protein [Gammaproteobacteria bacterium]NIT92067.1 hypothetical protein [Gammaproteobacteria bacterium]NIU40862.1 hypothetical protein [Gammaproteobacteria bacterium]
MVYYSVSHFSDVHTRGREALRRLAAILVTGFLCTAFSIGALAAGAPLKLCTAGSEGGYYEAGRDMAKHANPKFLDITVVETSGSMDNMQRMGRHECGAAIVQSDAYLVYQSRHRESPVEVTRNRFMFAEFAHLVCRRDAKVATTTDLLRTPASRKVFVGAEESGSALTWRAFTILDRRYGQIQAENVGGEDALARLLQGQAQCLFFVSGLGSEFGKSVNERGKDLRLIAITDDALRNASFGSVTLYEIRHFPKGRYGNLDSEISGSVVETLTVGATLVIERHWTERYPNGPSALMGALSGAMPSISQRLLSDRN